MGPSGAGKVSSTVTLVVLDTIPCWSCFTISSVSSPSYLSFISHYVQTVLLDALTLDAFFGKPSGKVTLNGVPITDKIFKEHCYVVVQHDKHWPYLTCRETLRYAAELYDVVVKEDLEAVVDEIIAKMGLTVCGATRNARLSGGQMRRLSLGIALLKQPTILFLDEPTVSLDGFSVKMFANWLRDVHLARGGIAVIATHIDLGLDAPELDLTPFKAAPDAAGGSDEAFL